MSKPLDREGCFYVVMMIVVAVLCLLPLLLSGCSKKIELDPNEWYCATNHTETLFAGNPPAQITRKVCDSWRRL